MQIHPPRIRIAVALLMLGTARIRADDTPGVFLVDLHSHAKSGPSIGDDRREQLGKQAKRFKQAGFDAVFHTPHSDLCKDPED